MAVSNLGANKFTLSGDRTQITFFPVAPGPVRPGQDGGSLEYQGPEGDFTFTGSQITASDAPLGTVFSVALEAHPDEGTITANVVLPHVSGVSSGNPVTFDTLLIKTTGRGFVARPGPDLTYAIVPLLGTAQEVILPL